MSIPIPSGFIIKERINGIINKIGKSAGIEQNWGYNAFNDKNIECILLFCNPGVFTIIDIDSLERVRNVNGKQVSWFIGKNGYAGCRTKMDNKDTVLTLHQHLMNHYGHGRGKESVDHINKNKLDNRLENLRIVTQSIQNQNRDKVKRHKTAKELPDEIKNIVLPKFIVYYKENLGDNKYREFFTVEGHPIQKQKENSIINTQTEQLKSRRWVTTKSNSVSIILKLNLAKLYVDELNKLQINPEYVIKNISLDPQLNLSVKNENNIKVENKYIDHEITCIEKINEEVVNNNNKNSKEILQWKVKQIYEAISSNSENTYKEFCENNNDISKIKDWSIKWATFVLSIKGKSFYIAESIIRDFIEDLRRIRHNDLCFNKNKIIVDRDDREQWPATTVVRAFLDGKINKFKEHTERQTGDNPEDPKWQIRWNSFVKSLEVHENNEKELKSLCSKFMTAQRTKRYRQKLKSEPS